MWWSLVDSAKVGHQTSWRSAVYGTMETNFEKTTWSNFGRPLTVTNTNDAESNTRAKKRRDLLLWLALTRLLFTKTQCNYSAIFGNRDLGSKRCPVWKRLPRALQFMWPFISNSFPPSNEAMAAEAKKISQGNWRTRILGTHCYSHIIITFEILSLLKKWSDWFVVFPTERMPPPAFQRVDKNWISFFFLSCFCFFFYLLDCMLAWAHLGYHCYLTYYFSTLHKLRLG